MQLSPYLPRNICLPTAPGLAEMLQNGPRFILFDSLRHHIQNIVHDRSAQLQIIVALHALLGDGLSHALRVTSFKLSGEQVAEPTF